MIGWLSGKVVQAVPDRLILDVGGVGYLVAIPLSTYYEIQKADAGAAIRLFIHTHVREDALALYGFWSEREKELFEQLIAVSGIGPRLAQVVLSGMAPDELIAALAAGDVARLVRIPGVGKKTAERMVVELRDKLQALAAQLPAARAAAAAAGGSDNDLVAALVNLGYKPSLAEGAVGAARKEAPEAAFHELLRLALRRLSRV
ncbi:MAG: Holliday junction branch migration protein RuvA [Thermoanaerobaculia bacterium]|jgi:Holliday junction DNA helicase RuvA|nr:Holliday junction branch migration protein RuvA [Thermoanaerobaculia bacterium]